MDRITTRIEEYVFVSDAKRAYERLAEYEDTGLTPEQILAMDEEYTKMAKELDLSYAIDIYPRYGSDVSAARSAGYDIKGALIGPGVHASHGCERTHIDGVMAAFYLCEAYLLRGI